MQPRLLGVGSGKLEYPLDDDVIGGLGGICIIFLIIFLLLLILIFYIR